MTSSYTVEKTGADGKAAYRILAADGVLAATLLQPVDNKPGTSPRTGCLLFFAALFLSGGDTEFADGDKGFISRLRFTSPEQVAGMELQRVAKGVVVKDAEGKEAGHLTFKKRELVCKYEVMAGDTSLGRLVPNGISHMGLQLVREGRLIAEFTKKPPLASGLFGHIHVYEEVAADAFPVLLGALLLWY